MPTLLLRFIYLVIIWSIGIAGTVATEEQCHVDCRAAPPRLVGPTRPSDAFDALGNPLALTRSYPYDVVNSSEESFDFPKYCEWGCTYFFVAPDVHPLFLSSGKSTLDLCFDQCDETFRYNVTVGYNDLIETARLECRDGCQIGLIRCQPGYFCIQASPAKEKSKAYSGGAMLPCGPGTYRSVDYNQVTRCEPCPKNHFREDIKGKSASDCKKCRAGTSTSKKTINTSIKDCVRCPAGTYSEEGSSCKCITPQSCNEEQLPFPADAEKRDSVPYIGRW